MMKNGQRGHGGGGNIPIMIKDEIKKRKGAQGIEGKNISLKDKKDIFETQNSTFNIHDDFLMESSTHRKDPMLLKIKPKHAPHVDSKGMRPKVYHLNGAAVKFSENRPGANKRVYKRFEESKEISNTLPSEYEDLTTTIDRRDEETKLLGGVLDD